MTQPESRSICVLFSPQELGLLRALLSEGTDKRVAEQLLVRINVAETAQLLPLLSRALAHVGLSVSTSGN